MKTLLTTLFFALSACCASPAATPTYWDHNGSQVSLVANGSQRQFYYYAPSAEVARAGVKPGSLLFDGRRIGYQYRGTAYVFSSVCGASPYEVSGPVSPDQTAVTMYGRAPVVGAQCEIAGYQAAVLVFRFISVSPPANVQSASTQSSDDQGLSTSLSVQSIPVNYDSFLKDWKACFSPEAGLDLAANGCTAALSYPALHQDDRPKLLQQQSLITRARAPKTEPVVASNNYVSNSSSQPAVPASRNVSNWSSEPAVAATSNVSDTSFATRKQDNTQSIILFLVALVVVVALVHGLSNRGNGSVAAAWQDETKNQSSPNPNSPYKPGNLAPIPSSNALTPYSPHQLAAQSMSLRLRRSQHADFFGRITFALDAQMDLSPEELFLIKQYHLGSLVVYDSKKRGKYADAMEAHLHLARQHAGDPSALSGIGKGFYRIGRASLSAVFAKLSLRITVDRLISGVHVQCRSLEELLGTEDAIIQTVRTLRAYLDTARTFDGREEVVEF